MNNIKKQTAAVLVIVLLVVSLCGCQSTIFPTMIREFDEDGNAVLNTTLYDMNSRGLNIGDTVQVTIGEYSKTMPIVDTVIEDDGKLQLYCNNKAGTVSILIYNGSFELDCTAKSGDMVMIEKQ